MKSNVQVNSSLFKAEPKDSHSIDSGLTIFHPIMEAGTYHGMVLKKRKVVGNFTIICDNASLETQVDIDLYNIDKSLAKNSDKKNNDFKIGPGGYAVLYSSFGEGGYEVSLKNETTDYHTSKLQKSDLILILMFQPGKYEITGSNQQKCLLTVEEVKSNEEQLQKKDQPVQITLNDQEFNPKEVLIIQGQGLIIHFETDGRLNIKLTTPADVQKDLPSRRHNWENPKYKYGKA